MPRDYLLLEWKWGKHTHTRQYDTEAGAQEAFAALSRAIGGDGAYVKLRRNGRVVAEWPEVGR